MSGYTEGPWILDGVEIRACDSHPMGRICDMAPGFSDADASLIAASPDLLEALQEILDYAESGWDHFPDCAINARKAIAKALA